MKILLILLLLLANLHEGWAEGQKPPREIIVGMDLDTAVAALRELGAEEGFPFDIDILSLPPNQKWSYFTLPDSRTIALQTEPSAIFPSIIRITGISLMQLSDPNRGKSNLKSTPKFTSQQLEKFVLPDAPGIQTTK